MNDIVSIYLPDICRKKQTDICVTKHILEQSKKINAYNNKHYL